MSHADHTRDPCPWVILNDFGGAFAMGAVGGGIWHGIKGARNSPRGDRLVGAISVIKARAPVTGGNFGVWGGMFSSFDCAVKGYRQKEDAWNAIISGFMTGGCLAMRSGPRAAFGSAVACGVLLGVFEGVGVLLNRVMADAGRPVLPPLPEGQSPAPPDEIATIPSPGIDREWVDSSHPSDPHEWYSTEAQSSSGTGGLSDNPSRGYTTTVRTGNYGAGGRGGVGNHRFVPAPELGRGAHNRRKSVGDDPAEGYPREVSKAHPSEGTTFGKIKDKLFHKHHDDNTVEPVEPVAEE
ncbi:translocase of the inner membrane [Tulasnella sp. 427]|nr:translocase of the inner membrane [Tulasnella sp. 427]